MSMTSATSPIIYNIQLVILTLGQQKTNRWHGQKKTSLPIMRLVGREFHDDFLSRNLHFNGLLLRYMFH